MNAPALMLLALAQGHTFDYVDATGNVASLDMDGGRTEVEHGDLDGDGHPDIALVGDHGSPFINTNQHGVTAWLGDGQGGWTLVQTGDFGYGGLALGDADGDGLMDVGYGVHHDYSSNDLGDQLLEVALGDGTGAGWTPWDDGLATNGETWGMFGTDFGDVDSDGDLDVGSNSFGCCAGVHVYLNQGDGTWVQSFGFVGGNADMDLEFCDVDGDGQLDLISANQLGFVFRGDGAGGFTNADGNLPAQNPYRGIASGDVDGDGRDEVSFVRSGGIDVWRWGAGDAWTEISGDLPSSGVFQATELVDVDHDGRADLVAAGEGQVRMWRWTPGDSWVLFYSGETTGDDPRDVEALRCSTDLDHNGWLDLSIVQDENVSLFTFQNFHKVLFESSVPTEVEVAVRRPEPQRVWIGGQVRFVDWTCAVPGTDAGSVSIELSSAGADGPWAPVASGLPNSGRHQLVAPAHVDSATCHVRVTATTPSGAHASTSSAFAIRGQVGTNTCTSSANSTGFAAEIDAAGSAQVAHEHLELSAAPVPANQPGLFFFGPNRTQIPYGNGTLCVASPQSRLPIVTADAGGTLAHALDFGAFPGNSIQAGDTLHFQTWFRDPAGGGAGFDFSDAREIEFAP